ncbi:hypothetical protein P3S68_022666 [Capsicum galapagoense]
MTFRFRGPDASSGMGVADHSKNAFLELKRKQVHRYLIIKINENKKKVVVEKTGNPAESFDDFTASLAENDCRYAVYDFDFVTSENFQKSKIFFVHWLVPYLLVPIFFCRYDATAVSYLADFTCLKKNVKVVHHLGLPRCSL